MYRYNVNESFIFCDTIKYEEVNLTVDTSKMFHLDEFNVNGSTHTIVYSQIRTNPYIAGILDLRKTYGKDNKKMLYQCKPDDKRISTFLIPYEKKPSFQKNIDYLYITFQFNHWNEIHPYGKITNTIGNVNSLNHLYEYMLYCKSLNQSIKEFTQKSKEEINKHKNIIQDISDKYQLKKRDGHIFTIDSTKSVDYDDAISVSENRISIYISNVSIILDHLNLWDSFSKRISTIYLPDKKRSMLPTLLTDCLCSLKEKTQRICIVLDLYYENGIIIKKEVNVMNVRIARNYGFEDSKLLNHKDYQIALKLCNVKNSYDLISKLMIEYNNTFSNLMKEDKNGIYKSITLVHKELTSIEDHINKFKTSSSHYIEYNENCSYLQMTSPIRRLVDLLNSIQICKNKEYVKLSENSNDFYNKWYDQLDYINTTMRYIRKVQSKCKLISIFEKEQDKVFDGFLFDKLKRSDEKYHYNVFLPELKIYTSISIQTDYEEFSKQYFKLFMFNDEAHIKKKIKIMIVEN